MHHEGVTANLPANETASAELRPAGQYGIVLIVLLVIGFIFWKIKNK